MDYGYTFSAADTTPPLLPATYRFRPSTEAVNIVEDTLQSLAAPNYPASLEGDEDCLFLNAFVPPGAESLPVLVWIHGGGFGQGREDQDLGAIIRSNNNIFVGIAIQCRVGESPLNVLAD